MQVCNDCSVVQWVRAQRGKSGAELVLGSILVAASLVTDLQQSGSSR